MSDQKTRDARPIPQRPQWGWFAWEATVGYIHDEYSPDATLMLVMSPANAVVMWNAVLAFGEVRETIREQLGFAMVLSELWKQVTQRHQLFKTYEAATRRPEHYEDDQWVDTQTLDALTRLVGVTSTVFQEDWKLLIWYRPTPTAKDRLQSRLIAKNGQVLRAGRGATLRDVCRNLYHNATPDYKKNFAKLQNL